MSPRFHECLMRASISTERLGELRMGSVGITLNPHFLLDREGRRTSWLVKRLRARRFADPLAKFHEFEADHQLLTRYFGAPLRPPQVLETDFLVLERNFDSHGDYEVGREYVMVQRFVRGTTLQEAADQARGSPSGWLRREVERFVERYRAMQRIELAIPDCFSIRSEHIKVDDENQRLVLIDTNNVVQVRRDLGANRLFLRYFGEAVAGVTIEALHDVFERICADYTFDRQHLHSPHPELNYREARAIEQLIRYFPRHGGDNQYLRELVTTFELSHQ